MVNPWHFSSSTFSHRRDSVGWFGWWRRETANRYWKWQRDGSDMHVHPLNTWHVWMTVTDQMLQTEHSSSAFQERQDHTISSCSTCWETGEFLFLNYIGLDRYICKGSGLGSVHSLKGNNVWCLDCGSDLKIAKEFSEGNPGVYRSDLMWKQCPGRFPIIKFVWVCEGRDIQSCAEMTVSPLYISLFLIFREQVAISMERMYKKYLGCVNIHFFLPSGLPFPG